MGSWRTSFASAVPIETSPSRSPLRSPVFRRLSSGKWENRQEWPGDKSPIVKSSGSATGSPSRLVEAEITWSPESKNMKKATESSINTSPAVYRSSGGKFACTRRLYPFSRTEVQVNSAFGTRTKKSQEASSSSEPYEWSEPDVIPSSQEAQLTATDSEVYPIRSTHTSPEITATCRRVSSGDELIRNSLTSSTQASSSVQLETYQNESTSDARSLQDTVQLSEDESSNDLLPYELPTLPESSVGQAALELGSPTYQTSGQPRRRKTVKGGLAEQLEHWANQQSSNLNIWLYKLRCMRRDKAPANPVAEYKLRFAVREFKCIRCFCDVRKDDQASCAVVIFDENVFAQYDLKPGDSFALVPPCNRETSCPGCRWPVVLGPLFVQPIDAV
uniref:Uncharacterized protein n=1 Tax=Trichuris muris TaxID=70415 RepID=A0A5S6Q904_TRIMR